MKKVGQINVVLIVASLVAAGCGGMEALPAHETDPIDASAFPGGKADSPYSECEQQAALLFVNHPDTDLASLEAAEVHTRARTRIIAIRDGEDGEAGTEDDHHFSDVLELDAVPYVGPVAFRTLMNHIKDRCPSTENMDAEVIFSPQAYEDSHLQRATELIDAASETLDIAMYSFRDGGLFDALERATARGVSIRLLFESASKDRTQPDGSRSARLEDMGIDVRWINRIMHHKFAIADGPRNDLARASSGSLTTGSGNWSFSAGTRFDENTLFAQGNSELLLRFQAEFNYLWDNSRDFEWNTDISPVEATPIDLAAIPDDPRVDVVFTSANFTVRHSERYGPTFSTVRGSNVVADRLVELIGAASESIDIASGHLRSRPVAEALMAKSELSPEVSIRIYLDGQEYLGTSSYDGQVRRREECLVEAGDSEARRQDCLDKGFRYSYALHLQGVPLRFKYYSYRWDYTYADQMHHKYMIFDGRTVASGSYNLSDNAEHNTMENLVIFEAAGFPGLVPAFQENFDALWWTGQVDGLYTALMDEIEGGTGNVPLVFPSMAIDWDEVQALKRAIMAACPEVNSHEFRSNASAHRYCPR